MGEPYLTSKLQGFGTTIFAEMTSLAAATGAVNLGQGFPDTDGPDEVKQAALTAIAEGRGNQYPPGIGVPELRHAIVDHQRRFYGLDWDADTEVLVTCGATEALAASLLSLVDTGDEVLCIDPAYDSYAACIAMAGGLKRTVTLRPPDFALDVDALRSLVTPRTKAILLNSPHNPTGRVFTADELAGVAAIADDHDLVVISDEAYEHLTFDGTPHIPFATLPGMRDRTVSIASAGKSFSFTGWKVGWVTARPALVSAVRTAKQFLTYVNSGPFQHAVVAGLRLPDEYFTSFAADLQAKRDHLLGGLRRAGFTVYEPKGTYFVLADVTPFGETDGMAFCRSLPHRCGVVAVPCQVFFDDVDAGRSLVRFAFCKRLEVLDDAAARLATLGDVGDRS
jgi:N-succinyldiaminopimelate aminotransferase